MSGTTGLHGFTGERADPTTNLVYLRARDYSPGSARFVQPDPLQPNAEGTHGYNPYWYANNNPGTFTDPAGTWAATARTELGFELSDMGSLLFLGMATTVAGAAPVAAGVGIGASVPLLTVVILFIVLILVLETIRRCLDHDCTVLRLGGAITGWIEETFGPGKSTITWGVTGAATGACVLALVFTPDILAQPVAQGCRIPQDDCIGKVILDVVSDGIEMGIDIIDPAGGASVVFAYAKKSQAGSGCGGEDSEYQKKPPPGCTALGSGDDILRMIRNITGITDPKELLEIKRSLHTTKSNLKNQGVTGKSHSKLCPNGDFWVEFKQGWKIVTTI